jgi:hypothetical protein
MADAYADGPYVNAGLLPRILELPCHIWLVQQNTQQPVQIT